MAFLVKSPDTVQQEIGDVRFPASLVVIHSDNFFAPGNHRIVLFRYDGDFEVEIGWTFFFVISVEFVADRDSIWPGNGLKVQAKQCEHGPRQCYIVRIYSRNLHICIRF